MVSLKNTVDKTQHLNLRAFKLNYTFFQLEKAKVKMHEANRKFWRVAMNRQKGKKGVTDMSPEVHCN